MFTCVGLINKTNGPTIAGSVNQDKHIIGSSLAGHPKGSEGSAYPGPPRLVHDV